MSQKNEDNNWIEYEKRLLPVTKSSKGSSWQVLQGRDGIVQLVNEWYPVFHISTSKG